MKCVPNELFNLLRFKFIYSFLNVIYHLNKTIKIKNLYNQNCKEKITLRYKMNYVNFEQIK